MQSLHLTEDERRTTLRRAQEIAQHPADATTAVDEMEAYLSAAEEAGIPRAAMLAALRERLLVGAEALREGDLVFAPSADGACYVARIDRIAGPEATVSFVAGGEHVLSLVSLRPLGLVPGRKLQYRAPDWGWANATIVAYDAEKQQARVSAMMEEKKVALKDLRLVPEKRATALPIRKAIWIASLLSGAAGTALGFLLAHL